MELPKRKHIRLENYDYNAPGYYFITVCTKEKKKILCDIRPDGPAGDVLIDYSGYGRAVREQLEYMTDFYPDIKIDKFVVMPNHIHMILQTVGEKGPDEGVGRAVNSRVSGFVGTFKRFCNKKCGADLWQDRSYDHVIRGEADYREVWTYIEGNPSRWTEDKLYIAD